MKSRTTEEIVAECIARTVESMPQHETAVLADDQPEAVHQLRVATRRLRSDLRTFREVLDEGWSTGLRAELAWIGAVLGGVRDAQVLAERLRPRLDTLDGDDLGAARRLVETADREIDAARIALVQAMASDRYEALRVALAAAGSAPVLAESRPGRTASDARRHVRRVVRASWRELSRAVDALPDDASDSELHRVRILAKRSRYAAEAAVLSGDRETKRLAKALVGVQSVLGAHQDSVGAEAWLRRQAEESPSEAFVAGLLVAQERREQARDRRRFERSWRRAVRRARSL